MIHSNMSFGRRIYQSLKVRLGNLYWHFRYNVGSNSLVIKPLRFSGTIVIGEDVVIQQGAWIEANALTNNPEPCISINDGCKIGHYNEIYATSKIVLENDVLTADRVYITDNLHEYCDPAIPIYKQSIRQLKEVRIGEGTWLGINVCIIGASIGKHCVIGANSVVTHDIPDYCVAVGSPARVIKRYNYDKKEWCKTNPDGSFKELEK